MTERENFNTAMAAILRADPKAVKEAMEREKQENATMRKAKGERKRGRKARIIPTAIEPCRVLFDGSQCEKQIEELIALAKAGFLQSVPHKTIYEIFRLFLNFVTVDNVPALRAGNLKEFTFRVFLGYPFEDFCSALRARDSARIAHILAVLQEKQS
jgi:hypothetical protein